MSGNTSTSERLQNLEDLLERKMVDWRSDKLYGNSDFNIGATEALKWVIRLINDKDPIGSIANDQEEAGREKSDLMRMVSCTESQMEAIKEVANEVSSMIGGGKDDSEREEWVNEIDEFLKQNGESRQYS